MYLRLPILPSYVWTTISKVVALTEPTCYFAKLPADILLEIADCLPLDSRLSLRLSCRSLNQILHKTLIKSLTKTQRLNLLYKLEREGFTSRPPGHLVLCPHQRLDYFQVLLHPARTRSRSADAAYRSCWDCFWAGEWRTFISYASMYDEPWDAALITSLEIMKVPSREDLSKEKLLGVWSWLPPVPICQHLLLNDLVILENYDPRFLGLGTHRLSPFDRCWCGSMRCSPDFFRHDFRCQEAECMGNIELSHKWRTAASGREGWVLTLRIIRAQISSTSPLTRRWTGLASSDKDIRAIRDAWDRWLNDPRVQKLKEGVPEMVVFGRIRVSVRACYRWLKGILISKYSNTRLVRYRKGGVIEHARLK